MRMHIFFGPWQTKIHTVFNNKGKKCKNASKWRCVVFNDILFRMTWKFNLYFIDTGFYFQKSNRFELTIKYYF